MNEKIGRYTEDEILEHLTEGEGRGFLGRSMYDAIFDKIHTLKTENEQLKEQIEKYEHYCKTTGVEQLQQENKQLKDKLIEINEVINGYMPNQYAMCKAFDEIEFILSKGEE